MKNKILVKTINTFSSKDLERYDVKNIIQRIILNKKLLDCVNSKEEYEYLQNELTKLTCILFQSFHTELNCHPVSF